VSRFCSITKLPLLLLFFSPLLPGSDLSTYRGFQLGMTLNTAVKHSGMDISEVTTIHDRPARIQELNWTPNRFSPNDTDPVEQVLFSFYNGQLFRMVVDYSAEKTRGLTSDDIIAAVSAKYGASTSPGVTFVLPADFPEDTLQVVARWEDADSSFSLIQLPYGPNFQLVVVSKRLSALVDAALAEGTRLDAEEAPGRLKLKEENDKNDLSKDRLVSKAHFRP
jgi:hypothetical protein